jgi:hypothetical protein
MSLSKWMFSMGSRVFGAIVEGHCSCSAVGTTPDAWMREKVNSGFKYAQNLRKIVNKTNK